MNVPYNTGKISIGKYYQPPKYIESDSDMLELQSYLIQDPRLINRQYWARKIYFAVLIFMVAIIYIKN